MGHQRPRMGKQRADADGSAAEDDTDRELAALEALKANMPSASLEDEEADYGYEYTDWEDDDDEEDEEDVERMGLDERFQTLSGYSVQ